jgi:hypothetical protein
MGSLRKFIDVSSDLFRDTCIALIAGGMKKDLARRDAERKKNETGWFTAEEAAVAEALGRIIVPSDGESPGMDEVGVLGRPAIEQLDTLVLKSEYRQLLYSRGLYSFDIWALESYGHKFVEIPKEDQTKLFRAAQQIFEENNARTTMSSKVWRRLRAIARLRNGSQFASQLSQLIRNDCLQVFYTSRVSWVWLEYDGPPMDKGYSDLFKPR